MNSNRLPSDEMLARRPEWVEGRWITLADGNAWSFAPPSSIPGYEEVSGTAARSVVDSVMHFMNARAIHQRVRAAEAGDPSGMIHTLAMAFALYQIAFLLGSVLLKRNYSVTDADCERLMPFNYQLEDLDDPASKLHQATPAELAISNEVAASIGVDIRPELSRIAASN